MEDDTKLTGSVAGKPGGSEAGNAAKEGRWRAGAVEDPALRDPKRGVKDGDGERRRKDAAGNRPRHARDSDVPRAQATSERSEMRTARSTTLPCRQTSRVVA